jgi:DNA mismatch endonuclease (patch repair protein)
MDADPSEQRSRIMAAVPQRDTALEVAFRRVLHACGLRFRLPRGRTLPGSPDVVFPAARVAVFVDGCFWHGCPVHGTKPKANAAFWAAKIDRNRKRDAQVDERLAALGWQAVRVWEHEVSPDPSDAALRVWATVRSREPL